VPIFRILGVIMFNANKKIQKYTCKLNQAIKNSDTQDILKYSYHSEKYLEIQQGGVIDNLQFKITNLINLSNDLEREKIELSVQRESILFLYLYISISFYYFVYVYYKYRDTNFYPSNLFIFKNNASHLRICYLYAFILFFCNYKKKF
jgi:hypothetical protein